MLPRQHPPLPCAQRMHSSEWRPSLKIPRDKPVAAIMSAQLLQRLSTNEGFANTIGGDRNYCMFVVSHAEAGRRVCLGGEAGGGGGGGGIVCVDGHAEARRSVGRGRGGSQSICLF